MIRRRLQLSMAPFAHISFSLERGFLQFRNRSLPTLLLAALLAALGGCSKAESGQAEPKEEPVQRVNRVGVVELRPQNLEERLVLPGTLEAWEDLTLATELAGPVRWVGPAEGERVVKGEAILRIDPDTQMANLQRARAECELRRKEMERCSSLLEQNLISQQEFDKVQNAYQTALADLEVSRLNLRKSTLASPVDGVLDKLLVDRGEYVSPGAPAAVVVQVDRLKALVDVPEKDVAYLSAGERVSLRHAALEGESASLEGEIVHLSYRADPVTRTYRAKVAVDNREGRMRPGMIVRMEANRRFHQEVLAVPLFALVDHQGGKVAFIERDGRAVLRSVTPGPVVGDQVIIRAGLAPGERLIVKGQHLLGDGSAVSVAE